MSKSLSVTFRIPAELSDAFIMAVNEDGGNKTVWLVDALRRKLNRLGGSTDARMMVLVERMEAAVAALSEYDQPVPPHPYNEAAVVTIVKRTIREGFKNGRIIAERLNEAGYQTEAGIAWDKETYQAWKRKTVRKRKTLKKQVI